MPDDGHHNPRLGRVEAILETFAQRRADESLNVLIALVDGMVRRHQRDRLTVR